MTSPASTARSPGALSDPLGHLAALGTPGLDDFVEIMLAWAQTAVGTDEIVTAVQRFHVENGKVFHDDSFYDTRTTYFFDHFLFERRVLASGATPFEMFLAQARAHTPALPQPLLDRLTWLGDFRHSIFQIVKIQERSMVVQDLITPAKLTVTAKAQETFRGLDRKDFFQGFLFKVGDESQLSSGMILHPQKVGRLIRRFLKLSQKEGTFSKKAALARLANVQLRHLRHRHVDPKTIYAADMK